MAEKFEMISIVGERQSTTSSEFEETGNNCLSIKDKSSSFDQLSRNASTNLDAELTQLFPGELIVSQAQVMRYKSLSIRKKGTIGMLYITNFKMAFISSDQSMDEEDGLFFTLFSKQQVINLDEQLVCKETRFNKHDYIPLTIISKVIATYRNKNKKISVKPKKQAQDIPLKYDLIEIQTSDMRCLQYDFNISSEQNKSKVFKLLSHNLFPTNVANLFAFDHTMIEENVTESESESNYSLFDSPSDYESTIKRLGMSNKFKVSQTNKDYSLCRNLPKYIVVPTDFSDDNLWEESKKYPDYQVPTWLWSNQMNGTSLYISSGLTGSYIRSTHLHMKGNKKSSTKLFDLDTSKKLPSLKQLQESCELVKDAYMLHSTDAFWTEDSTWLGRLSNSKWLQHVQTCLQQAELVMNQLTNAHSSTVVYDDTNGKDYALVISSLAQVIFDPYYRTLRGLQSLVQRDWIQGGHMFSQRLAHIKGIQSAPIIPMEKKGHKKTFSVGGDAFALSGIEESLPSRWTKFTNSFTRASSAAHGQMKTSISDSNIAENTEEDTPLKIAVETDVSRPAVIPKVQRSVSQNNHKSQTLGSRQKVTSASPEQVNGKGNNKDRFSFSKQQQNERQESPVFQLFLDALHQLIVQFPSHFEYTEYYLILILDIAHAGLFTALTCNSAEERSRMSTSSSSVPNAWSFINNCFIAKYRNLFMNLTFSIFTPNELELLSNGKSNRTNKGPDSSVVLPVNTSILCMQFWTGYFARWLPCADLRNGASAKTLLNLKQTQSVKEIEQLQNKIKSLQGLLRENKETPECKEIQLGTNDEDKSNDEGLTYSESPNSCNSYEMADNYLDLVNKFYFLNLV